MRQLFATLLFLLPLVTFSGEQKTVEFDVTGMTCPVCAYGVQLNLSKLAGVEQCEVSYKDGKATLVYNADVEPDLEKIRAAVIEYGYTPGDATVTVNTK